MIIEQVQTTPIQEPDCGLLYEVEIAEPPYESNAPTLSATPENDQDGGESDLDEELSWYAETILDDGRASTYAYYVIVRAKSEKEAVRKVSQKLREAFTKAIGYMNGDLKERYEID